MPWSVRVRGASRCAARSELDEVDGLVIPGGESTTMDKLVRAFELHEPLRSGIAAGCRCTARAPG